MHPFLATVDFFS